MPTADRLYRRPWALPSGHSQGLSSGQVAAAALLLAAAGSPRGIKEGGTFRVAVAVGSFNAIDPALPVLAAGLFWTRLAAGSWGTRQAAPRRPPPRPGSCRGRADHLEGRQDLHLHHPQGRALLRRQAGDGPRLRARRSSASSTRRWSRSGGRFRGHRRRAGSARRQGDDRSRGAHREGQDADPETDEASPRTAWTA